MHVEGPKLHPGEAVAALIVTRDNRYLMQHRDSIPEIFFPGYWGNFGGGVEPDESVEEALLRELVEELDYRPGQMTHFSTLTLDFAFAGLGKVDRHFFEMTIDPTSIGSMVLGEGQGMALIDGNELLSRPDVIPYDATVIWQHMAQARF